MDVVVDFDRVPHSEWVLANLSRTDPGAAEPELPLVMQFRVGGRPEHGDPSRVPENLAQVQAAWAAPQAVRNIFYGTEQRPGGGQRMLLNNLTWGAPVAEMAQTGAVEQWNLINPTAEWHSFHIHSAVFKVLDRGDLAMGGEGSAATAWGGTQPRLDCESGLKDTVLLPPNTLTRILLRFGPYAGRYVYHCHMLEHEDDDMMRPYELSAAPRS
jgi:spore coat protein A